MLWCSIDSYLRILRALQIEPEFISVPKLAALTNAYIGKCLPVLCNGIINGVRESLGVISSKPPSSQNTELKKDGRGAYGRSAGRAAA
jgi:hypothetical protein